MSNSLLHFSTTEQIDQEYFQEYNKHNVQSAWFILTYILRCFTSFAFALQMGIVQYPVSLNYFMEYISINMSLSTPTIYMARCGVDSKERTCDLENFVLELNLFKNIGLSLGGFLGGFLADLFGRRPICLCFAIFWGIFAHWLIFVENKVYFQLVYVFATLCCAAVNVIMVVNFAEIANRKNRFLTVFTVHAYVSGIITFSYVSNKLAIWKYIMAFVAFSISILMIFASWYMPESPRWLLTKNKKLLALKHLQEISGKKVIHQIISENRSMEQSSHEIKRMMSFLFIKKWKYSVIVITLSSVSGMFYEAGKWFTFQKLMRQQKNELIVQVATIFSYIFMIPVYIFLGKKYGLFFIYGLLMIASVIILITFDLQSLIYFYVFGMLFGLSALNFVYLYALDIFPTFIRCTAGGIVFSVYQNMAITCIVLTDQYTPKQNYYCTFAIGAALGLSVIFLPPTSKRDLLLEPK